MKIFKLIVSVSLLVLLACEGNTEIIEEIEAENIEKELKGRRIPFQNNTNAKLQKKLQWVSYITAQVIMSDNSNRIEFFNALQGRKVITLHELIGEHSNLNFKSQFKNVLRSYIQKDPPKKDPIFGTQSPPHPIITCDEDVEEICLMPPGAYNEGATNAFLRSILEKNCIELYLPEGLHPLVNQNLPYSITSTAHPLSHDSFNSGFRHSSIASPKSDPNGVLSVSNVSQNYLGIITDNVIVARPYKNSSNCTYQEYLLLNFTTFLNP